MDKINEFIVVLGIVFLAFLFFSLNTTQKTGDDDMKEGVHLKIKTGYEKFIGEYNFENGESHILVPGNQGVEIRAKSGDNEMWVNVRPRTNEVVGIYDFKDYEATSGVIIIKKGNERLRFDVDYDKFKLEILEFGEVGEAVIGKFSGIVSFSGIYDGPQIQVEGTFNVKRVEDVEVNP